MTQTVAPVLLACLGNMSDAAKTARIAQLSVEEWRLVAELAKQHGVASLLYHNLQRINSVLPDDINRQLKQVLLKNTHRMMRIFHDLQILLRLFQENDIQVIVLKGAYLAEVVYDNIGLRMMGDIDLMVKKHDLERADQFMLALGCKPHEHYRVTGPEIHHFGYWMPASGIVVEIHWSIVNSILPFQIDLERLWARVQPATIALTPAWVLTPEDLLVHLCVHMTNHIFLMRIRMICDINETVRHFGTKINWQEVAERAGQWGAVRAVYVILRLTKELLGAAVPEDWLASLRQKNFTEEYIDLLERQILIEQSDTKASLALPKNHTLLSELWGIKGLRNKLGLIHGYFFPPREVMARRYPVSKNSWRIYLYYLVDAKSVLMRRSATLWRLVRGDSKEQAVVNHYIRMKALQDWLRSG